MGPGMVVAPRPGAFAEADQSLKVFVTEQDLCVAEPANVTLNGENHGRGARAARERASRSRHLTVWVGGRAVASEAVSVVRRSTRTSGGTTRDSGPRLSRERG